MIDIRPVRPADIEPLAGVLARAFEDDPGALVFESDRALRRAILPQFFRTFLAASLAEGADVVVPISEPTGVAIWFGPEAYGPSPDAMGRAGFGDVLAAFGAEASERMLAMVGEIEAQHDRRILGPHLRLEFFAVDPAVQGRGIGTALVDHGHRRADELGLPCYLETFTKSNVAFYEHRGYAVIGTYPVGRGVPVYAMRREPGRDR